MDRGHDGFLKDHRQWSPAIAQALVDEIPITLDERHLEIIDFIRDYHARYHHLPNNRMFIKAIQVALGPEKGPRSTLIYFSTAARSGMRVLQQDFQSRPDASEEHCLLDDRAYGE